MKRLTKDEQQLWDNVVLLMLQQGKNNPDKVATALIKARQEVQEELGKERGATES